MQDGIYTTVPLIDKHEEEYFDYIAAQKKDKSSAFEFLKICRHMRMHILLHNYAAIPHVSI